MINKPYHQNEEYKIIYEENDMDLFRFKIIINCNENYHQINNNIIIFGNSNNTINYITNIEKHNGRKRI